MGILKKLLQFVAIRMTSPFREKGFIVYGISYYIYGDLKYFFCISKKNMKKLMQEQKK